MPNLWLPSSDSFFEVEKIPLLGSGKLDLKSLREKALEFVANEKGATRIVQAQASA
jgi:acyl-[acyl-carrier-protein]-phospholipid O-acyltransferase/long-chain-fatty-acid--[acyl-carrier-protein] ligase